MNFSYLITNNTLGNSQPNMQFDSVLFL